MVSGVGGQYNFVAMAHELDGARSILLLRATHGSESNIVFNYGHQTIPRHLRDIVVTQYGIADRRFQDRLAERLAPLERRGLLPLFPLGTDFDAEEQRLVAALLWLKRHFSVLGIVGAPQPRAEDLPALARMGLAKPRSMRERVLRRIVTCGLRRAPD